MNPAPVQSLHLPVDTGWIHGLLRVPRSPRAGVLLLPSFFHEMTRSYRLFAVLCDALAEAGIASLRIDYRGTGDSSGDDDRFLPSHALADAEVALAALAACTPRPPVLIGVRAGAFLASTLATRHGLEDWAWHAPRDGASLLAEWRALDHRQRGSRWRFPFLREAPPRDPTALLGHRLHPGFEAELAALHFARAPALRIGGDSSGTTDVVLDGALGDWVGQVDLQGPLPSQAARALGAALAARLAA